MKGFFPDSQLQKQPPLRSPRCGSCGLCKTCNSPKMQPTGQGKRGVLIVAEAPGASEDEKGTQLIGKAGQELRRIMKELGWNLDRDCWKTNVLICRPPDNRKPTEKEIHYCRPNLLKTIKQLQPETIILMGGVAVKSLIGHVWKESVGAIGRWVGWRIPCQELNTWICPTWHPSYLLRENNPVLNLHFQKHLEDAFDLSGRPWEEVPKYRETVKVLYPGVAAERIRHRKWNGPIAFDYETNCLKPDAEWAQIVSCAVSDGKWTFAYPWAGMAIAATSELLRSDVPKIASNLKFEERWTRAMLCHGVNGWAWDTMLKAHELDNRPGITGLKFQAFVQLGQGDYDSHIDPYLKATGPGRPNRTKEILDQLLPYNGMDALLTRLVAEKQGLTF